MKTHTFKVVVFFVLATLLVGGYTLPALSSGSNTTDLVTSDTNSDAGLVGGNQEQDQIQGNTDIQLQPLPVRVDPNSPGYLTAADQITDLPTSLSPESATGSTSACGVTLTWQPIADLHTARSRLGIAFTPATNKYYVLGGEAASGRNIPIEEYDALTNTWTDRANLLVGVSNTGAAAVGNYVYVPGGYDGASARAEMQRYNPITNAIDFVAALPVPNFAHAVVAAGNKIFVLGGGSAGSEGTTNYIYDVNTNTWSSGMAVPTAVEYPAATYDGTYIYLIGGRTAAVTDLNIVQVYNPIGNSWSSGPALGTARGGPSAFFDGYRVWAVGGGWINFLSSTEVLKDGAWSAGSALIKGARTTAASFGNGMVIKAGGYDGTYVAKAEKMDIPGTWNSISSLHTPRSRLGVAFTPATNKYYAIGGEGASGRDIPIEEYNPATNTWTDRANLLVGVSNTGAVAVGNYIFVPGGYDGISARAEMQRYNPITNVVDLVAALPAANFAHAVVAAGNKVFVLGGGSAGSEGSTNYIYDVNTNTWSTGMAVPTAVEYPAATYDGNYIYLIGGRTSAVTDLNIVQVYNPAINSWISGPLLNNARGGPAAFFGGYRVWAVGGGWGTFLSSTENLKAGPWSNGQAMVHGARTLGVAYYQGVAIMAGGYNGNYSGLAERLNICWVSKIMLPIMKR